MPVFKIGHRTPRCVTNKVPLLWRNRQLGISLLELNRVGASCGSGIDEFFRQLDAAFVVDSDLSNHKARLSAPQFEY